MTIGAATGSAVIAKRPVDCGIKNGELTAAGGVAEPPGREHISAVHP
jgi:hypothetical protein